MIVLSDDKKKIKKYNNRMRELANKYKDSPYYFKTIDSIDEIFIPYKKYLESLTSDEKIKYKIVPDAKLTFDGVYIVLGVNDHYLIEELTNSKKLNHLYAYGVADNATQILENCICPNNSIILLTAVFKDKQPSACGWRLHKHGKYYGIQNPSCEYIFDEEEIEMVFTFRIVSLVNEYEI